MMPKVSVIVPVYNTEKYLPQCIDSLMAQTLKDVEYIFIDDNSTDNSSSILESYAMKDNRIHVVVQEKNVGPGTARNIGLALAKGEYLSFLDSDDFFEPTLLHEVYECAVKNDVDIVLFQYLNYDNITKKYSDPAAFDLEKMPADVCSPEQIADFFSSVSGPTAWAKLFRRDFILKEHIQFPDIKNTEDTFFSYIALLTAKRIARLNKRLLYYRCHQTSSISARLSRYTLALDTYNILTCIKDDLIKREVFNTFHKGFLKLSSKLMRLFLCQVSLREISLLERYKMCHELNISPLALFPHTFIEGKCFMYVISPQWIRTLWRKCKKLLGMKLN